MKPSIVDRLCVMNRETAIGSLSQNCNTYEQQNTALNSTQEHLHSIYIEQHCVGTLHANFGRNMTNILSKPLCCQLQHHHV